MTGIVASQGDSITDDPTAQASSERSAHVLETVGNAIQADREFAAVDTNRQSASWLSSTNVKRISVTVLSEAAGTAQLPGAVAITFDAPNDTVADTWLTAGSHLTDDAQSRKVSVGETKKFDFVYGLTRIDLKRIYGTEALRVTVDVEDVN